MAFRLKAISSNGDTMKRPKPKYPSDWKTVSRWVRFERAKGQCECVGHCGLHKTTPGPRRCCERDGQPAKWAKGKVVLTVAHICQCDPPCSNPDHLLAMCNRCHLRIDVELHVRHAKETRERKKNVNHLLLPI